MWRAPDSTTTRTAPKSGREPLAPAQSAYLISVRHSVEISCVFIFAVQNGVRFGAQNATRHAQTYAQPHAHNYPNKYLFPCTMASQI